SNVPHLSGTPSERIEEGGWTAVDLLRVTEDPALDTSAAVDAGHEPADLAADLKQGTQPAVGHSADHGHRAGIATDGAVSDTQEITLFGDESFIADDQTVLHQSLANIPASQIENALARASTSGSHANHQTAPVGHAPV